MNTSNDAKTNSKRKTDDDNEKIYKNSSNTAKKSKDDLTKDVIHQAWSHYRAFLDSEHEIQDGEVADIDELYEALDLLKHHISWEIKDYNKEGFLESLPKFNLSLSSFGTIQSLLPVLLSMIYFHLGNDAVSQELNCITRDETIEDLATPTRDDISDLNPAKLLESSLRYFPFNAASLSMLANYKRMTLKDTQENICLAYEIASENAQLIREVAISILDEGEEEEGEDDIPPEENLYKEWIELLLLDEICGAEYIEEEDKEEEENDDNNVEEESTNDHDEPNISDQGEQEFSPSETESVTSFMAALLNSSLGKHDKALVYLKKFNFSHRIHPSVWTHSKKGCPADWRSETTKASETFPFEPKAFRGNGVLPPGLYERVCKVFSPGSAYWKESNYQNRGYYSFFQDLSDDIIQKPRNLIQDIVVNHLLPLAENEISKNNSSKIVGFEWWTHSRPLSANLGHQMHFDTDEAMLEQENTISHPIVSSVLYLTGNKDIDRQTAGSTIVFNQTPQSAEVAQNAYISHAQDNSYMVFPGNCLHGVLPCPGVDSSSPQKGSKAVERLTFMVGFWTRRVPDNIKEKTLYCPCGELPPVNDEHTWISEINNGYEKNENIEVSKERNAQLTTHILPSVTPAWECIGTSEKNHHHKDALTIPTSLDHRFFVHGAPHCFRDSLFKNESVAM